MGSYAQLQKRINSSRSPRGPFKAPIPAPKDSRRESTFYLLPRVVDGGVVEGRVRGNFN
jgi:hypothetical protein